MSKSVVTKIIEVTVNAAGSRTEKQIWPEVKGCDGVKFLENTARKVRYGSSIVGVSRVTILKYRSNIAGITLWAALCVRYSNLGRHTRAILDRYSACDMDTILERYFRIVTFDMLTILERYLILQAVEGDQVPRWC